MRMTLIGTCLAIITFIFLIGQIRQIGDDNSEADIVSFEENQRRQARMQILREAEFISLERHPCETPCLHYSLKYHATGEVIGEFVVPAGAGSFKTRISQTEPQAFEKLSSALIGAGFSQMHNDYTLQTREHCGIFKSGGNQFTLIIMSQLISTKINLDEGCESEAAAALLGVFEVMEHSAPMSEIWPQSGAG